LKPIGRAEVFARAFSGLDAAHVQERTDPSPAAPRFDSPERFVEAISAAAMTVTPSLGLGHDFRLLGGGISGCALVADEFVHLTAFPATGV